MSKEIAKKLIANKGWFKEVDESKTAQIVELSYIKQYSSGEFIYMVGEKQDNVFFVIDGRVKISIAGLSGEEFVLAVWEKGTCFGEGSFSENRVMHLEARVMKDATLLVIPHTVINSVLGEETKFQRNIMQDMINRSKGIYELIEILLFKPLYARLAARLLHFISLYGQQSEDGTILPIQLSQSDLAGMSGGSRQRANKVFREWEKSGIVTKPGRYYIVHDIPALKAIMEQLDD